MITSALTKLDEKGMLMLPENIRIGLPSGTQFLVRRQGQNITLLPLLSEQPTTFDLSARATSFANELIAEDYGNYMIQTALANADGES